MFDEREYSENMQEQASFQTTEPELTNEIAPEEIKVPEKKAKKTFFKIMKPVLVTALCAFVAGGVFGATDAMVKAWMSRETDSKKVEQITKTSENKNTTTGVVKLSHSDLDADVGEMSVENIVDVCLPSVVSITNKGVAEVITFFGNYQTESVSSGSGIIIGENETELLIVTNYHVVADSKELTVVFSHNEAAVQAGDASCMSIAQVKGYDADKDIAVIAVKLEEIPEETKEKIRIAVVGNSDEIKLGSGVVAIGNALGYGQSVTHGIISAIDREVTMEGVDGGIITNEYIQTDAAINSGNSGGALLNMKGELIGINSAKISSTGVEGMGYAIPITDVEELISELMSLKTREVVPEEKRGYLGIYGTDVTSSAAQAYGMPMGIFVQEAVKDSPADKSNLESGDIITKIDGASVSSMAALQDRLAYYEAGETVVLTVKRIEGRSYEEHEVEITLATREDAGIDE